MWIFAVPDNNAAMNMDNLDANAVSNSNQSVAPYMSNSDIVSNGTVTDNAEKTPMRQIVAAYRDILKKHFFYRAVLHTD